MNVRRCASLTLTAGCVAACTPVPPAAPTPHTAIDVNASFGRTWDALIDDFARNNIPIKTIERVSGLIATDPLIVGQSLADAADCGTDWTRTRVAPTHVQYNALVRGDSAHATIRVTAQFTRTGASRQYGQQDMVVTEGCSTHATWETSLEQEIKAAAEKAK